MAKLCYQVIQCSSSASCSTSRPFPLVVVADRCTTVCIIVALMCKIGYRLRFVHTRCASVQSSEKVLHCGKA